MDYYNLVRALIRSNDIVSAVEALQDMESRKVSLIPSQQEVQSGMASTTRFSPGKTNAYDLYELMKSDLKSIFVKADGDGKIDGQQKSSSSNKAVAASASPAVTEADEGSVEAANSESSSSVTTEKPTTVEEKAQDSKRRYELLEDFYYALIDQVQKGQPVPRVVVDAILEAMGSFDVYGEQNRVSHLGRVKAIFEEYPSVFKLSHDMTSYIALIKASRRHANYNEMLTIFQQMEQYLVEQRLQSASKKSAAKQHQQQQQGSSPAATTSSSSLVANRDTFLVKEGLTVAYSNLYHYMMSRRISRSFLDIWGHMQNEWKTIPDMDCLIRLGKYFSHQGVYRERDVVLLALSDRYKETLHTPKLTYSHRRYPYIPKHLMQYLEEVFEESQAKRISNALDRREQQAQSSQQSQDNSSSQSKSRNSHDRSQRNSQSRSNKQEEPSSNTQNNRNQQRRAANDEKSL